MTIKPIPTKSMGMSLAVITGIEGEWDIEVKNEESKGIWYKALKSKTYSNYDIPEDLWGN